MDSRLRGSNRGFSGGDGVIPSQAGIHADESKKYKKLFVTTSKFINAIFGV
jgi:hypothetical protein